MISTHWMNSYILEFSLLNKIYSKQRKNIWKKKVIHQFLVWRQKNPRTSGLVISLQLGVWLNIVLLFETCKRVNDWDEDTVAERFLLFQHDSFSSYPMTAFLSIHMLLYHCTKLLLDISLFFDDGAPKSSLIGSESFGLRGCFCVCTCIVLPCTCCKLTSNLSRDIWCI